MDLYFVVAELSFPVGVAERWRASAGPGGSSVDEVVSRAEGPTRLEVRGDAVSLRAFLIDSAYFLVKDDLETALVAAARLGARGEWYSGDHVAGQHAGGAEGSVAARAAPRAHGARLDA